LVLKGINESGGQQVTDYTAKANHGYRGTLPSVDTSDPEIRENCSVESIPVVPLDINYNAGKVAVIPLPVPVDNYLTVRNDGDVLINVTLRVVNTSTGTVTSLWNAWTKANGEEQMFYVGRLDAGTYSLQVVKDATLHLA